MRRSECKMFFAQSHAAILAAAMLTSCCLAIKCFPFWLLLEQEEFFNEWIKATVSPSWTFKSEDIQRVVLALPQLCSVLYWRRPASVRCRSSLPCWPASVWGTTPRPSDPASESPEMSGSSAPGSRHTHGLQVRWTQMTRLSCVGKQNQYTK